MSCTLENLLSKYEVVIPIIQRDYAQGREGKESVLNAMLDSIQKVFDDQKKIKSKLDFVYGVKEEIKREDKTVTKFYPLDGQQRLTTLWLVHWYIAFKAEKTDEIQLNNFYYETRESSTDFCRALCKKVTDKNKVVRSISDYIVDQNWFFNSWKQDPTVKSMLNALRVIEDRFRNIDAGTCWPLLKENVEFELLEVGTKKIPIESSDDLFIKMNARGKKLTQFENFKSQWVSSSDNKYSSKIDNEWNDVFWNYAEGNNIDFNDVGDLFYQFINRYTLCKIILSSDKCIFENKDIEKIIGEKNADDVEYRCAHSFMYINDYSKDESGSHDYKGSGHSNDKRWPDYLTYLDYESILSIPGNMDEIDDILTVLHGDQDIVKDIDLIYGKMKLNFKFLDPADKKLTQEERIYFFAVCRFLLIFGEQPIDRDALESWIRVVRNIVRNSDVRTESSSFNTFMLINGIADKMEADKKSDVYQILENEKPDNGSLLKRRYSEEIFKARLLSKIERNDNDRKFREKLHEAEDYAFFNGVITFLYKENDIDKVTDIQGFKKCFENRFNKLCEVIKANDENPDAEAVKKMLSYYDSFDDIRNLSVFISKGFDSRANEPNFRDNILCGELTKGEEDSRDNSIAVRKSGAIIKWLDGEAPAAQGIFKEFIDSSILKEITTDGGDKYQYTKYGNIWRIKKIVKGSFKRGLYIHSDRKDKCAALHTLVPDSENYYDDCGLYLGLNVGFEYSGKWFEWRVDLKDSDPEDNIYLRNGKQGEIHEHWSNAADLKSVLDALIGRVK